MNGHQGVCLQLSRYSRPSTRRSGDLPVLSNRSRPVGYRTDPYCHPHRPNPLTPWAVTPPWARRRSAHEPGRVGQERSSTSGTRCYCRRAGLPPDLRIPEKQSGIGHLRLRDISVLHRRLRLSSVPITGYPMSGSPPRCACLRPSLISRAIRSLTAASATSPDGSSASGHVPLRAGRCAVEFDVSVEHGPGGRRRPAARPDR